MSDLATNLLYANNNELLSRACKVSPIRTYIDVGANYGSMLFFAPPGMETHAFEPVPQVFAKLVEVHGARPDTYFNQLGLSDTPGRLTAVTVVNCWTLGTPEETHLSVVPEFLDADKRPITFDVDLTTLDDYCASRALRAGVIKLDVDGYEFKFLRGATKTILRDRPFIAMELSYLVLNVGDSVEAMLSYIFDTLHYTIARNDGGYLTKYRPVVLANYPWESSFDVTLLPDESVQFWLHD